MINTAAVGHALAAQPNLRLRRVITERAGAFMEG